MQIQHKMCSESFFCGLSRLLEPELDCWKLFCTIPAILAAAGNGSCGLRRLPPPFRPLVFIEGGELRRWVVTFSSKFDPGGLPLANVLGRAGDAHCVYFGASAFGRISTSKLPL